MVAGWVIATVWFVASICGTGAFWFFLGAGDNVGTLLSGIGAAVAVVIAIRLQIRNDRVPKDEAPPGGPTGLEGAPAAPGLQDVQPGVPDRPLNLHERDLLASISTEGRELLVTAAHEPHGEIFFAQSIAGLSVTVGERRFCQPGNARNEARARRSVEELLELGLVDDRGGNGSILSVTDEGFRAADLVERLRESGV